jgi:hypothetical protein
LINDQGEVAVILEDDDDQCKIVGYTLPKSGESFQVGEVRDAFLAQTMENPNFEDSDREILSKYLESDALSVAVNSQTVVDDVRSVYKYKPVALKTRPVV